MRLGILLYAISSIVGMPIATAIVIVLAFVLPAASANYDLTTPPGPATCEGILAGGADAVWLKTEDGECRALAAKKVARTILKTCSIGDLCRVEGMIKDYSHETYGWTSVNKVRKISGYQGYS